MSDLRRLPFPNREKLAIELLDFRSTSILPNGDRPRTIAHGSARISGGVILAFCVAHNGGVLFLEIEHKGFNEPAARREPVVLNLQLRAELLRAVEQKHRDRFAEALVIGRGK